MADGTSGEQYGEQLIGMLDIVWGDGWMSPGGPDEVARLVDGIDFADKSVLDIGSGSGGVDCLLAETFKAGHVTGIDVEDTVIATARKRAEVRGLAGRIDFIKVAPGALPLADASFDIVFSKDFDHSHPRQARPHARGLPRAQARRAFRRLRLADRA